MTSGGSQHRQKWPKQTPGWCYVGVCFRTSPAAAVCFSGTSTEQLCVAAVRRGQDIASSQSHKSYRPFTVLAFRLTHRFWGLITAAAPGITQLLPALPATPGSQHGKDELPPGKHTEASA